MRGAHRRDPRDAWAPAGARHNAAGLGFLEHTFHMRRVFTASNFDLAGFSCAQHLDWDSHSSAAASARPTRTSEAPLVGSTSRLAL